ncbi:MAG: ABC transporter ATP-binding protein [Lachnospiraceae bacterium]|nr:ABC transporter ATP-binding protein [Lachnospiraceae bacterium]
MKLELNNVVKSYGKKPAVNGLSIVFEPGIYGILGPNGAGKSTTMRMVCTVEKPDKGSITYNGSDIYAMGGEYRDKIGYVPQKAGYYPDYTAGMFLKYIAGLKGIENEEKVIKGCLEVVNLWDVRDKKLRGFSGGMKQRVNIAQALINNPGILILDEPTVGLDPDERMSFKNLISSFAEEKIIIFATHIVSDVEDIAGRVLILDKGTIKVNEETVNLINNAEVKVWECNLKDIKEINFIKDNYKTSKIHYHNGTADIRVISDVKPCENAVLVQAGLEEIYKGFIN